MTEEDVGDYHDSKMTRQQFINPTGMNSQLLNNPELYNNHEALNA